MLTPVRWSWSAARCRATAMTLGPGPNPELPGWKAAHKKSHKQVRARVAHVFARMKTWKIPRDCRLKGDGVHHAVCGIARLHNLNLAR